MRLGRNLTMKQHSEFSRVRKEGLSKVGRFWVLGVLKSEHVTQFRYGIVTTKKVGKAHERNQIRRRLRAILIEHGEELVENNYIVTIARWRAKDATYAELKNDWLHLAHKLNIYKQS